ncbi:GDP-mannose 4,6-dehydratase [Roseococcus sp. SDR]|uniref:GDP-mannose 4,6-dehydratase n=1 Tax=Roseococcus sp. SDR TaxID=2835532 RepID=UPI001BCBCE69|nr:GDP-mannose 4,6-dehydratase [Roseococcus sp. SDR]MBS7792910.1 GDP-mannose 4,6-dehydratase [Roseococcus sp. SDR]MBV1848224.1 GDP-mannose 4,6-dehydratase [Roseococcus sp. SDR]
MPRPVALIIGITGQDGSFLAELLLRKGYAVHGLRRRTSVPNLGNLASLIAEGAELHLHHGDLTEGGSLLRVLQRVRPEEIYNLAGMSLAAGRAPQNAAALHALGTQRLLDAVRLHDPGRRIRLFQGSSYEIFAPDSATPADEAAGFAPESPNGVARLQAYWLIATARERHGMHASSGIAFPHASARAAPDTLLRHIARGALALSRGDAPAVSLGALDLAQHWGHARDHAEAAWRMLQQPEPGDLVLAGGPVHTLRQVVQRIFALAGAPLAWQGTGWAETGLCSATGRVLVRLDPAAPGCRGPLGDASRARRLLGWEPATDIDALLAEILADERLALARRTA